jgi:two-component system NtrC family sensor kinase
MNSNALWVASHYGPELQEILSRKFVENSIYLWSETTPLFTLLTNTPASLLLIDLPLLTTISPTKSFFATLSQIAPHLEVIILASFSQRAQAIQQLAQGAADYLLFPLDETELEIKVGRVLEKQNSSISHANAITPELLMLREASQEINQTLPLNEVLKIILAKAAQITQADIAQIYLTTQSGNLDKQRAVTSPTSLFKTSELSELLFNLALETAFRQEVICQMGIDSTLPTILMVPLISGDKLIGVLALGRQAAATFSENHIRWLSVFCGQAATAIENARLFQDLASAYIDLAQSREKILQSRNTLQVLFDGISDGLYILNQHLTINVLNKVEAERQGFAAEDLIGQSFLSLPWSQSSPQLLERINESLQTGHETTWISPDHETEPYLKDREFRIYPIRNRLAHIEQVVVFAQDVSERRRWQASLFRSANLAAVGQLAGSIAHQINNPLTIAMANSQLLLLELDPGGEMYDLTSGIFKAGERIQGIVENLLEFSNQETYFFVQTDLINTIEGALALVFRSLKKARIEIIKDYQVQPLLSASISHLKLVWMNLLLNARDAVADYAPHPQITIATAAVSDREVKITVTDNGYGIEEKDIEQLFRPFYTTKLAAKALGLGLYSTHTIIEHHNGQIKVSSNQGVSTKFEVILPLDNPRDL